MSDPVAPRPADDTLPPPLPPRHDAGAVRSPWGWPADAAPVALLDAMGEAIAASDLEGRVTFWNRAAERAWGWTAAEVMGRPVAAFAPAPALRARAAEIHRHVLAGGSWAGAFQGWHREGRAFPIMLNVAPARDAAGRIVGTVAVCTDLTAHAREHRVQRVLAEAGRLLASSLDVEETLSAVVRLAVPELADACLLDVVEDDGTLRPVDAHHADPAHAATLHALQRGGAPFDPDAITPRVARTGRTWWEPDLPAAGLETITRVPAALARVRTLGLRSGIAVPMVARGRTVGVLRLYTGGARTLGPDDVALAEELARRAALAVDNARLYAQAQAALAARERVLHAVSHDLRGPLGAVVAHAELLRDEAPPGSEARERADVVREAAAHMERMIGDLLDVARLEAGHPAVDPAPVPPADLLREARRLLAPAAAAAGVPLRVAAAAALPPVRADRARVLRVLGNLVQNALAASPPGRPVRLRAERIGDAVRFSVEDRGPGVPPEEAERVFEAFQRGRSAGRGGLGLGLAIARGLVEAHGGRIGVEARPGGGAAFRFTLPAVLAADRAEAA